MTQAEILEQTRFQCELRGVSQKTRQNYLLYARLVQEHYGKPADEINMGELQQYLHHLRVSEVAALRVQDIDSEKMQIFITASKGEKERYAILSPDTLELLRDVWRLTRLQEYLFYPRFHKERHLSVAAVQKIFGEAKQKVGITKPRTVHSLRHSFATHLLEDGASIYHIKQLLDHSKITTSCIYLHLVAISDMNVQSPLDKVLHD